MPSFETVSLPEAQLESSSGKRADLIREYVAYIEKVVPGNAGRLGPSQGETLSAVRRRLGAAARHLGKSLTIKRGTAHVFFWLTEDNPKRRRRAQRRR